jgi:F-type H+-transporting ATPase subunit a
MAHSPVLHVKDSYYFDVPKSLHQYHYQSLDEVPRFLRDGHPDVQDPAVFNRALAGKILIPQPFGTLKNLYERQSGFCISRNMVLELFVGAVLCVVFISAAQRMRNGDRPRGKFWNFIELLIVFIRDEVARPAIGGHDADRFVPLLWTIFFFILGLNLVGMVPWAGAPTAAFGVTLGLAFVTFLTVLISGTQKFGVVGFWLNQAPHMDLAWYYAPIKWMVLGIEVLGLFIKHGVLGLRLMANMVAGHLVLLSILGMAFSLEMASHHYGWWFAAPITVIASAVFSILELFVAFLQAYVFTFLSALFIGAAVHHH